MESTRREPALGRFLLRIHRNRLGDLPPVAAAAITLLHLRVLRLGFLQDGDVGVSVFPECELTQRRWMPARLTASPEPARSTLCQR